MIVNKYTKGSGGGSGSGVTPAQVQQQIDSALTHYWESGETKDYVDEVVSGISLDGYYTSGETDAAIAQAVSGLASEQYVQDALSGVSLEGYWDSAQTEEAIAEAVEGYATSGDMQSAFTLISETQRVAAAGLNQLEGRIDELSAATPSVDLSGYYTSAQTEDAISAATAGKADAANVTPKTGRYFPDWNAQGIITGSSNMAWLASDVVNGRVRKQILSNDGSSAFGIYAPESVGTAGQILVSTGHGAPVWSAVTMPDMSDYYTSAQTKTYVDDKVASAETQVAQSFANLDTNVIQPMQEDIQELSARTVDLSAYWTSAQTDNAIAQAVSGLATEQYVQDALSGVNMSAYWTSAETKNYVDTEVTSARTDVTNAFNMFYNTYIHPVEETVDALSGAMPDMSKYTPTSGFSTINGSAITNGGNIVIEGGADMSAYYTSAQTEEAITSKNYVTSAQVETQIVAKNYITSADTANFVTSAQVETQIEAKNYVNSGDVKSQVEAYNYATVSQIPTVPTSNTAFTNDAGYITDAAIENLVTSAQVETQITSKGYATVSQIPTVPTSNTAFTNDAGYITSAAIANMVSSTYVSTIWKGTQAQYDAIVDKDPNTFYIIVNN